MRRFCCLLSVVFVLFQGCNFMKPHTAHPVTSPAQGAAPVEKHPAVDALQSAVQNSFFDPNNYSGSDIERINAALKAAGNCGGTVRIGKRKPALQMAGGNGIATLEERDIWIIDSAILVPGNVHLIIDNPTVKLSNICRDNMIRSANCWENCLLLLNAPPEGGRFLQHLYLIVFEIFLILWYSKCHTSCML